MIPPILEEVLIPNLNEDERNLERLSSLLFYSEYSPTILWCLCYQGRSFDFYDNSREYCGNGGDERLRPAVSFVRLVSISDVLEYKAVTR